MLLEEFDPAAGVIEPNMAFTLSDQDFEVCDTLIMVFDGDLLEQIRKLPQVRYGGYKENINGKLPWYIYEKDGLKVGVCMAYLGAPALIGTVEELHAAGFEKFIIFGSCGILDGNLATEKLILPTSALRDEGVSYHYAPASDEIGYPESHLAHFIQMLDKHGIEHITAKTWTTDAFFRETPDKVKRRIAAGAQVVDMESAALMAWSQFRKVPVYQFFYTNDYVDHENGWNPHHSVDGLDLMIFFQLALKLAKELKHD